jgi:hypothetical protein
MSEATDTVLGALFVIAGLVNLPPVLGVLSAERLAALYGIEIRDPDLLVLMRHRAVLFGIVGMLLVAAAVRPDLRAAALAAGLTSMLSFVALAVATGGYSPVLRRIVFADVAGSVALFLAALLWLFS